MSVPISDIKPSPAYVMGRQWIGKHFDELVTKHPNQWVGIYKERVVAADPDLGKAEDAVPADVPFPDVVFQFIDDGTLVFVADGR